MPLSGLNPISVRPRGGVAKVELIPASEAGVATATASFATQNKAGMALAASAAWAFREDRAHYSEERVSKEPLVPLVRHTLEMELPATATGRQSVEELAACMVRGVVAVVTMASGEALVVGWSERFGVRYPLRLTAVKSVSGRLPGDFPTISLTLESVDADPSSGL